MSRRFFKGRVWFAARWKPGARRFAIEPDRGFLGHINSHDLWMFKAFRIFFWFGPAQAQIIFLHR